MKDGGSLTFCGDNDVLGKRLNLRTLVYVTVYYDL